MNRSQRVEIIEAIENKRGSKLVAYFTGDRPGVAAQIGADAVWPLYRHLRNFGFVRVDQIDLMIFSRGGAADVPWTVVSMLRECCETLNVLVPFRAHSAATMIALGADTIVMGRKGELGPIDPALTLIADREGTKVQEEVRVEDVMAYVAFLKERAGLTDQSALTVGMQILATNLGPSILGQVYRTHSQVRLVARNLLTSHREPLEEQKVNAIVELLAEKIYSHGHSIGRQEAMVSGLRIEFADEELDGWMWDLMEEYGRMMKLEVPVEVKEAIPDGQNESSETAIMGIIESTARTDLFRGKLEFRHMRAIPNELNLNVGLTISANINPENISDDQKELLQRVLQAAVPQLAPMARALVENELRNQLPIASTNVRLIGARWQDVTDEGI